MNNTNGAQQMLIRSQNHTVAQDTDIVTLEFTYNDERDGGYTKPSRKAFEQLLRKLLRLPSRCAPRSCAQRQGGAVCRPATGCAA